ncbi:MAG: AAA family ATPase, partial [Verrucomicrobiota bacterium]
MKPLTTSIYTFADLIRGGYQYVDKTEGIYRLVREYKGQYFLSRPRRFGKSLLVSTLKSIFQGRKELFKGLSIYDTDYAWKTYPVIHLDMGDRAASTADELKKSLKYIVDVHAQLFNFRLTQDHYSDRFRELIDILYQQRGPVVILIDEYDKPLLGHLGKESAKEIQDVLKTLYSVIKTTEPQQRFVLLTGVSKFSKVSVFSDLNNLTDLTMDRETATLLGYTQEEVEINFPDYIERLAKYQDTSKDKALSELREWYNGYRFHQDAESIYNPVSVMKCLQSGEFRNYWFETGTPTFLLELLKRQPVDMNELTVPETAFSTYDPAELEPLPLLFQTGYLTIHGTEQLGEAKYYHLDYPNREIRQSFNYWLARQLADLPDPELNTALLGIVKSLERGAVDEMLEHL